MTSTYISIGLIMIVVVQNRVARWQIFKTKIPILVNFGGPWNGNGWNILWPF
jgi:hypothetical protein